LGKAAATAFLSAADAFQLCSKQNIQIHGGMGYTWDSDCHLYYRRAFSLAAALGGRSYWEDQLVELLKSEANCEMEK